MRLDELFPFPAERTEFSDSFYSALGRTTAICSVFEANWRALAHLVGLQARGLHEGLTQETIDHFLQEIEKRRLAHYIGAVVIRLGLSEETRHILDSARAARNLIAHDFALGIEREIQTDVGRARKMRELREIIMADSNRRLAGVCTRAGSN